MTSKRAYSQIAPIFGLLLLITLALPLKAQTPQRTITKGSLKSHLQTKRIAVFKNNSAFYIKSGQVPSVNGKFIVGDSLPQALFGTLWFHSPDNLLRSVSSYADTIIRNLDAGNISQMLRGNLGKTATLYLESGENEEQLNGKILAYEGDIITMQSGGAWTAVNASRVVRVDFTSTPSLKFPFDQKSRVLEINFKSQAPTQQLDMMYLQNGLGWVPNYKLELIDDDKARLELRALLVNDAEDINGAEIQFVVGVPNFMYADRVSPLVDAQNLSSLMSGLAASGSINQNMFSNSLSSQVSSYEVDTRSNFSAGDALGGLDGSQTEDLFFYKTGAVNLPKSGRAFYDLFRAEIPIEHIYEATIEANNSQSASYHSSHQFNDIKNKVVHKVKMTNNTKYPWTTGTALAVSTESGELRPISQDRLLYTAIGGESYIKLTESPEVQVLHSEKEVSREPRKLHKHGYNYDLITIAGEAKVKNYKGEEISLNLKRTLTGELLETDEKWLTARNPSSSSPNSLTDVCWELQLKSGQEKIIKYSYKAYVR